MTETESLYVYHDEIADELMANADNALNEVLEQCDNRIRESELSGTLKRAFKHSELEEIRIGTLRYEDTELIGIEFQ